MADSVEQEVQEIVSDDAFEWRRQQYEAMMFGEERAFNEAESIALANSTQSAYTGGKDKNSKKLEWNNIPLSWQKVKDALDAGCTPALALEIFVNVDAN